MSCLDTSKAFLEEMKEKMKEKMAITAEERALKSKRNVRLILMMAVSSKGPPQLPKNAHKGQRKWNKLQSVVVYSC
jgi:hypothetical protein